MEDVSVNVPVLVVGGGPTGLFTAYMLSKHGVKSLLIEKYPQRLAAPKAHALCPRTLEFCRQYGLDTNALRKLGSPRDDAYWVNFLTNLSGERIGYLPYERMDVEVLESTPEMIHNVPQPDFERFVAEKLAFDNNVELRKGIAFRGDRVITTVEERATKKRWAIASNYVIGCDGAKSEVRKSLNIETEGEDGCGLGLNSGLADAHNLVYKIAAVHQGWAKPSILDTYEADRRQIALVASSQSVKNGKTIFSFLKAVGTAGIDDVDEARANMYKTIHDPAKEDLIAQNVEGQREHFDNVSLKI
ncbi:hypothetical protein N0V92_003442 [Colletotrichum tropicale]|nr:hypothetical protein N0V92_003442 [Colletotrichum tropicale]